ncbi:two component transcriptional regulator, LytTR family [Beutenbergia cavernae DSM 12333]|uniref:Two component transcriptional regulator, LytTR family n=1 Tax=Beutenbergia cavernae (strain ATCC BAA-8 / DSM 12333 / CCUG 43141 / JCM 11478 / NBRC 16432 / NCIMB 13614 / HKI 0122) TaxID=471853 RepID=C5C1Z4_BEUC1|nr:two component transcriptional regulator, LytTR family [Beutenbergia cavernae DSM 12333]
MPAADRRHSLSESRSLPSVAILLRSFLAVGVSPFFSVAILLRSFLAVGVSLARLASMLTVLAVDDEPPALRELAYLLEADELVGRVLTASDGAAALRLLETQDVDVAVLDIRTPVLSGLDLARVLARFAHPPAIVFVTAYDEHAVDAFDVRAVDYVMKPYRPERLAAAVRRAAAAGAVVEQEADGETIAVELAGVTRFVRRGDVLFVSAHGDYARLHTPQGEHLVRIPLSTLAERWVDAGFVRIHRSHLVQLAHVRELHSDSGHWSVVVAGQTLPVSRRHARDLRESLLRRGDAGARAGARTGPGSGPPAYAPRGREAR